MKKSFVSVFLLAFCFQMQAQTNPIITNWLINTTNLMGRHYVAGNSTPINDNVLANVQSVQYSTDWVYVDATGIPAYITGPFQDGNNSLATEQTGYFKLTQNPTKNNGTPTTTTPGNIGIFINGVALFDYRDGVAWNPNTNTICGGPGNPPCPGGMGAAQAWNRDAIPAERRGFDCAKAHPAMGNYHHHQNPSAFNLDKMVISDVCDLYPADGLYVIDSTKHSPLLGFAADGFPIYGAFGYKNLDGTGGIVRMKSGYHLKNQTTRANGPTVGQVVGLQTFFNGYFREDYEFIGGAEPDVMNLNNGRVCVTPEYPNGIFCYFATVDANWNSAYPYVVGPTFYGVVNGSKVQTISEPVTNYNPSSAVFSLKNDVKLSIFPNPAVEFIAVQAMGILTEKLEIRLTDLNGKLIQSAEIQAGSTISNFDCRTLYTGVYLVSASQNGQIVATEKVVVKKD